MKRFYSNDPAAGSGSGSGSVGSATTTLTSKSAVQSHSVVQSAAGGAISGSGSTGVAAPPAAPASDIDMDIIRRKAQGFADIALTHAKLGEATKFNDLRHDDPKRKSIVENIIKNWEQAEANWRLAIDALKKLQVFTDPDYRNLGQYLNNAGWACHSQLEFVARNVAITNKAIELWRELNETLKKIKEPTDLENDVISCNIKNIDILSDAGSVSISDAKEEKETFVEVEPINTLIKIKRKYSDHNNRENVEAMMEAIRNDELPPADYPGIIELKRALAEHDAKQEAAKKGITEPVPLLVSGWDFYLVEASFCMLSTFECLGGRYHPTQGKKSIATPSGAVVLAATATATATATAVSAPSVAANIVVVGSNTSSPLHAQPPAVPTTKMSTTVVASASASAPAGAALSVQSPKL